MHPVKGFAARADVYCTKYVRGKHETISEAMKRCRDDPTCNAFVGNYNKLGNLITGNVYFCDVGSPIMKTKNEQLYFKSKRP